MNGSGVTAGAARFVATLGVRDLPEPIRHEVLRAFVNGVGCLVGGATHDMTDRTAAVLLHHAGRPAASLLGRNAKTDLLTAALLNGLAGAAYSFDDTYGEAMLHPSGPILAAMLSLAEIRPVTGETFLAAYAGALEVSCRLTRALTVPPAEAEMAWSQSGIVAGIGAALGCGRMLGLDATALETAVGIAASEASGTRAAHGSMTASLIFGRAAQSGLRAALLAQGGFTSAPGVLEHGSGFAAVFARSAHLPALTEALGSRFELLANTYKPYPCGVVIHPAIDGMLNLRRLHGIYAGDIARIFLQVSPRAMALAFRPTPATDIEAKVSLHHWVASAAVHGKAGIAEGKPEVVADPVIAALRGKVQAVGADDLTSTQARIGIDLLDGRRLDHTVSACTGSADRPMSDEQLSDKCREQAEMAIGAERAAELTELCWKLGTLADAADVARAAS